VVITEEQAMKLLIESNPVPDLSVLDRDDVHRAAPLAELDRRNHRMTELKQEKHESLSTRDRRKLVTTLSLMAVGVLAVILVWRAGEPNPVATVEAYFETFNSGDVQATLDFFVDEGGEFNIITQPPDTPFTNSGFEDTTEHVAWSVAGETILTDRECSVVDGSPDQFACTFMIEDIHRRTAGFPALEGSLEITVENGRFVDFAETIVLSEGTAFTDYLEWLVGTHPEESQVAARVDWASVEEAVESGEARVRYVAEWSESLGDQPG
jgi:hypothetical protein